MYRAMLKMDIERTDEGFLKVSFWGFKPKLDKKFSITLDVSSDELKMISISNQILGID